MNDYLTRIEEKVDTIMDNHITHIYERLGTLEGKVSIIRTLAAGVLILVLGLYFK